MKHETQSLHSIFVIVCHIHCGPSANMSPWVESVFFVNFFFPLPIAHWLGLWLNQTMHISFHVQTKPYFKREEGERKKVQYKNQRTIKIQARARYFINYLTAGLVSNITTITAKKCSTIWLPTLNLMVFALALFVVALATYYRSLLRQNFALFEYDPKIWTLWER